MPTYGHDIGQMWLSECLCAWREANLITHVEAQQLVTAAGTTLTLPSSHYTGSLKELDWNILPRDHIFYTPILPSFCLESGWSESISQLEYDRNLLLTLHQHELFLLFLFYCYFLTMEPK